MTEMEELERNTKIEYAKQRGEEVGKYMEGLFDNVTETERWRARGAVLDLIVFTTYWTSGLVLILNDVPDETFRIITDIAFIPLIVSVARTMSFHSDFCEALGELNGCLTTLRKLGMLTEITSGGNSKRKIKRKSLFSRFKELFERVGTGDKKEAEAFA